MRLAISFAALFLSVALLQLSSGGVGPLDALSGLAFNFTTSQVGLLGSAHFVGFFIGCWWAPRLLGSVGHSRAFAAFTALGAIGMLGHTLSQNPYVWALLRVASGMTIAGCYTIIEGWLQAKVTNETRGRAMGIYRIVDLGASLGAQLMIGVLAALPSYMAYNVLTLLCCASLLPLTLTKVQQPEIPKNPRMRPTLAWSRSPLAAAAVVIAGLTASSFRMVGPVYGQEIGLSPTDIGYFLAAFVAGGALAQYPAGWLADRFDRRWVLIWFSAAALLGCAATVSAADMGRVAVMAASGLFGFLTFPIYSIAAAHAHDFATSEERVELSAALLFFFAVGAIASPLITSALIDSYGPPALFGFIAVGHALLVGFGLLRMRVRDTNPERTAYVYAPRTSPFIGRLLRRARERR
ncbi:MAG: MFS transporter [Pseudomonadota bacterium]